MDEISQEKLLYTEGPNDKFVTISLRQKYGHSGDVFIEPKESEEQALKAFAMKITNPNETKRLGLIVDADENIEQRISEIQKELSRICHVDLTHEQIFKQEGCIHVVEDLKIGIWIMPNNVSSGRIEDFLFEKLKPDNALFLQVEKTIFELEKIAKTNNRFNEELYKSIHRDKAKLHTYMAWSNPPDLSMGMAVKKGFFPETGESEKNFKSWIEELFYK